MPLLLLLTISLLSFSGFSATIAIIDTGFDLDHQFLKPKILKNETDEEPLLFNGWNLNDNSHLKKAVVEDETSIQEILKYRSLKAKGHREGLTFSEFEWFKKKSADEDFMEKVKLFRKHTHGTFVAGIALREGENINIFPIRGLNLPHQVIAVESAPEDKEPLKSKTPDQKFDEEIKNSLNRVSRKFSRICQYLGRKNIQVVNASYGITYKSILTKFRESFKEITGSYIDEQKLQSVVDNYFNELYRRGERTIRKYPKMLFVFSAGNSGLDNDRYHHYPSRIKLPNTLTVAAINGNYLASFSNYGEKNVDIGAPGVAVLSVVPKVYSSDGTEIYSPASGTSMAAPYIANLAAQILNLNEKLKPEEIKKIILETGDVKLHLKPRLASGAMVSNETALRAALLSRDMSIEEAINLGRSNLIPVQDKLTGGKTPEVATENLKKKVMDSIPTAVSSTDVEEEGNGEETTKSLSSSPKDPEKGQPDNSGPPVSALQAAPVRGADPAPASQSEEQPLPPSGDLPASSSPAESKLPQTPDSAPLPSLPQS